MSIQWALFDLDGCLVDSTRAIPASINAGLGVVGVPPRSAASLQWCIGPPLSENFAILLAEHDIHEDEPLEQAINGYRAAYPELSVELTSVVPGVVEMLQAVDQRRVIVTSKPADYARPLAEAMGLMGHFEDLHGPGTDLAVEPKAVTLGRAMSALGVVTPATAVMVGDRHHDVDAGRDRGTRTVGVTWGAGDRAELVAARADVVVDVPRQLVDVLATMT